ncbi:MAG: hypothetical protein QNK04_10810 [Myxococcota bacterium]|nr:hypothetical protein [Myxococcota bacterium]
MALHIPDLTRDSIEDAAAYWLYAEDEAWERWRLVPDSQTLSPDGRALRLAFELDGDGFELVLIQRGAEIFVKFDDRLEPEQEIRVRCFDGDDESIVMFDHGDETVFVHLELATAPA